MHWKGYDRYLTVQAMQGNYLPSIGELIMRYLSEHGDTPRGETIQFVSDTTRIPVIEVARNIATVLTKLEARGEIHKGRERGSWGLGADGAPGFVPSIPTVRLVTVRSRFTQRRYTAFSFGSLPAFLVDGRGNLLNPEEFVLCKQDSSDLYRVVDISGQVAGCGTVVRCAATTGLHKDCEYTFVHNVQVYRAFEQVANLHDSNASVAELENAYEKLKAAARSIAAPKFHVYMTRAIELLRAA